MSRANHFGRLTKKLQIILIPAEHEVSASAFETVRHLSDTETCAPECRTVILSFHVFPKGRIPTAGRRLLVLIVSFVGEDLIASFVSIETERSATENLVGTHEFNHLQRGSDISLFHIVKSFEVINLFTL